MGEVERSRWREGEEVDGGREKEVDWERLKGVGGGGRVRWGRGVVTMGVIAIAMTATVRAKLGVRKVGRVGGYGGKGGGRRGGSDEDEKECERREEEDEGEVKNRDGKEEGR